MNMPDIVINIIKAIIPNKMFVQSSNKSKDLNHINIYILLKKL